MSEDIIKIRDLKTYFYTNAGIIKAVDGVSFDIKRGEVFGLVGESGSGKTLTALSILKLINPPCRIAGGEILFGGKDLLRADEEYLRNIRGSKISIVFQEPSAALNPVFTIGYQIMEAILAHKKLSQPDAKTLSLEYLKKVHIAAPEKVFHDYPHQLSGGTKQRVCIAIALINSPELLILDEPTTALDVTIQAQVLDLLDEIIDREKLSILFISHDFGIVARMCDRIAVMRKGRIVESGNADEIINNPKDPYTISLLESAKALS